MPRPGPRRPLIAFRLSEAEVAELDQLAEWHRVTRSDVIRGLVQAALESADTLGQACDRFDEIARDRTLP